MNELDVAVAGMSAVVGILILLIAAIVVAQRRWTRERPASRRELNQVRTHIDAARGYDLEQTQVIVRGHRAVRTPRGSARSRGSR